MLLTGPFELGTIVVTGTRGFSLRPLVDPLEGNTVMAHCGSTPCLPGETSIEGLLLGSAFPRGVATFEGNVYDDIDNIESPVGVGLGFTGTAVLPPASPTPTMVTARFALTTESGLFFPEDRVGITGGGTATLWLSPFVGHPEDPPSWVLDQIRYDFNDTPAVVPEPGTMLLFATGALAAWRFRRRPNEK
jgi:PEP-CTERM motif